MPGVPLYLAPDRIVAVIDGDAVDAVFHEHPEDQDEFRAAPTQPDEEGFADDADDEDELKSVWAEDLRWRTACGSGGDSVALLTASEATAKGFRSCKTCAHGTEHIDSLGDRTLGIWDADRKRLGDLIIVTEDAGPFPVAVVANEAGLASFAAEVDPFDSLDETIIRFKGRYEFR